MKIKFILVLFYLFTLFFYATAKTGQVELNEIVSYYSDSLENLEINDVLFLKSNDWKAYKNANNLKSGSVYWAKFTIKNQTDYYSNKVLIIGKKRDSDFSEIYVFNQGNQIKHAKSGYFLQRKDKDIEQEQGSKFFLHLKPHQEYVIYLRVKNISGFPVKFNLEIIELADFYEQVNIRNLVFGFIVGILWIMLLYNLLIFVYNRDTVYIYYSLYVFGMIFNILSTRYLFVEYFLPENPCLDPYVFIVATGLATASYFQFLRLFLNTKKEMRKWDKTLLVIVWSNIIITFYLFFVLLFDFDIPHAINISNILNFIVLLIGLAFMGYLLKHRSSLALFFIIGTIFLVFGTISSLVFIILKIEIGFNPTHLMNIGIVGQILFFSLGLGFKISLMEKAKIKVQKQLIFQLQQNEELKDKVNRELEQKIQERTKEIQQKNNQLNQYAHDLVEKNNLLIENNEEINQQKEEIQTIVEVLRETNETVIQQNREIERVNQSMTDSINSARRIQSAMLPVDELFEQNFEEHFVIYLPRDIVSGDFYWLRRINQYIVVIAADCTGHGVPGAFVSIMGMDLLNEIVAKSEITQANQILDELREQLKNSLNQSASGFKLSDGMDLALCVIDTQTHYLQFAGANNPLYIIRDTQTPEKHKLTHIKPDKQPIGSFIKERPFTNHGFQLEPNDSLYLFSDGFVDQFGGVQNDKYKTRRFKELLFKIQSEPMNLQKQIILNEFENWKGDTKQIDDIVILGIKPKF